MGQFIGEAIRSLDGASTWSAYGGQQSVSVSDTIPAYFASKGFSLASVNGLARSDDLLGQSIDELFLGNYDARYGTGSEDLQRHKYLSAMASVGYVSLLQEDKEDVNRVAADTYDGGQRHHSELFEYLTATSRDAGSYGENRQRVFRNNGASRNLFLPNIDLAGTGPESLRQVPIAIVGAGASGVLAAGLLSEMGFGKITVFDKRGRTNGLWQQDNVREGSKNNPFALRFGNIETPSAHDVRVEGSGRQIDEFVTSVIDAHHDQDEVELRKAKVTAIKPGDLKHTITFEEDGEVKSETFPIVIYAPGIGQPLDPNDPDRMTTPMKRNEVGQRWQKQFETSDDFEKLGKRVVLVGLGNSTAEIVYQLQRRAPGIDYRILTHKPFSQVRDPREGIFRNLRKPELTRLAGDLPHIEDLYNRAFRDRKIISDITEWHHEGGMLTARDRDGIETRMPFDSLFTLIGYGQDPKTNRNMGLQTGNPRTGNIKYDFDGEVQRRGYDPIRHSGRRRVYPGYFALGPILKNRINPNAVVIPGIQHQLQFQAHTILMRAGEVAFRGRRR